MVLATPLGLRNLECGLGNNVWTTFSLSYASYFAEVLLLLSLYMFYVDFESSAACISMWH